MYASLLSVLLIGIWPIMSTVGQSSDLEQISVAQPAPTFSMQESISASGAIVLDSESGQVLYAKQATVRRPMASITKLMTALIIAENHDLDEIVKIPKGIDEVVGNIVYLPEGEQFTVGDLLSALLIASGNDAAITLAEYHSGSVPVFVEEMNERAIQLGLKDTSYADPTGLDHVGQYSTPRDIAWLTKFVMEKPVIAKRMEMRWDRIYSLQGAEVSLIHTHALLNNSSSVIAGKTGTTDNARQCLVSVIEQDGRQYIIILLYSNERYADMDVILETMNTTIV